MTPLHDRKLSRRNFCLCCIGATTFAASGGWLTPRQAFARPLRSTTWGQFVITPALFTRLVYEGV